MVATHPLALEVEDQVIIARAADAGFRLVPTATDRGTRSWEWRRGNEPRPQFTNRRVALHWMGEFLEYERRAG